MRKTLIISLCVLFAVSSLAAVAFAKKVPGKMADMERMETPQRADISDLPADVRARVAGPMLSSAVADTFHLAWYSFDNGPNPDPQGWVRVDKTAQIDTFFHVADASELDGGTFGNLQVLEGTQSMWCGVDATTAPPFCGYATLPGYGNGWNQILKSKDLFCDSVRVYYKIWWDSEPGYDATVLQYWDANTSTWINLPVNGGAPGGYDGAGALVECMSFTVPNATPSGTGSTNVRFQFTADGAWSDEDGLWPTDGAVVIDSITVECYDWYLDVDSMMVDSLLETSFSDFEPGSAGAAGTSNHGDANWQGVVPAPYGQFGDLYPALGGVGLIDGKPHTGLQEDPCLLVLSNLWAWFDHPNSTNYSCATPVPQPLQGAMPFGGFLAGEPNGLYLDNEVWSPLIPVAGSTGAEWRLIFLTYRDLPLDNLQFYQWSIRSWDAAACPGQWRNFNFVYFGGQKDWLRTVFSVGQLIDPGIVNIQLAVGAVDMCPFWCSIFGSGACHSHAPMIDEVHLERVNTAGPQWTVRHLDLFQDNFPEDGTTSGTGRADAANDIHQSSRPEILPGDSVAVTVSESSVGVAPDPNTGIGSAVYMYVSVWPAGQPGKSGPEIEAPEVLDDAYPGAARGGSKRFPLVDSLLHDGTWWYCIRADTAFTATGGAVEGGIRQCFDMNDNVFTSCDTVCYVLCAADNNGDRTYFSRRLNGNGANFTTDNLWEALNSPMEFQILPGGGWKAGGDILYVDDADDRAGPPQLFFDAAFAILGIDGLVDRYDVLGPSSNVGNGLGSRVKNIATQISDCYQKILWSTSNLSSGLVGDGGQPNGGSSADKSNSWAVLFQHLDQRLNNPGLYLCGDDLAQDWITLTGPDAIATRTTYMDFALGGSSPGDHVASGEPVSPCLVGVGPCFIHLGVPDSLIAYGGCAAINDFDLLIPLAGQYEFTNPNSGAGYVISQTTQNAVGDTARVILSGFDYAYIRNKGAGFPDARTEHMADIIDWLQNDRPEATGVGDQPRYETYLANNYPNPFNPTTTIKYGLRERAHVSLKVYNVAGQLVKTLVNEVQAPTAVNAITWHGDSNAGQQVASGVYFYKLVTKNFTQTKKMVLLK